MKASGRKALQPRNIFLDDTKTQFLKPKTHVSKENLLLFPLPLPVVVESSSIDASLAEELTSFKKKLERLREDREKTEKLLKEKDEAIDLEMKNLLERGEIQKTLEIQVDRLFRLKELHSYSSKISPIRSLRAKEQQHKRKSFSFEIMVDVDAEEPGEEISSVKKDLEIESPAKTTPPCATAASSSSSSSSSSVL